MPKPRLLLLDTGAVIAAFQCRGWSTLCANYEIVVPSVVVGESDFYRDEAGKRHPIDLAARVAAGEIVEYAAPVEEFAATLALLHPELRARVDAGEQEALTYLRTHALDGVGFLTADGAAIEAAVAFGAEECALSLDDALRRCGVTKKLAEKHTGAFVQRKLAEGHVRHIQGRSLA